jgi:hypothetical protein
MDIYTLLTIGFICSRIRFRGSWAEQFWELRYKLSCRRLGVCAGSGHRVHQFFSATIAGAILPGCSMVTVPMAAAVKDRSARLGRSQPSL